MVGRRGFVSLNLAHREEDIDRVLDVVREFAVGGEVSFSDIVALLRRKRICKENSTSLNYLKN